MASGKCLYLRRAIADLILGSTAWSPTGTLYVALSQNVFAASGTTIAEPDASAGYARVPVVNNDTSVWPAADAAGAKTNLIDLIFPDATADWGTIRSYYFLDVLTPGMGNGYYGSDLIAPQIVPAGPGPRFVANAINVSEL